MPLIVWPQVIIGLLNIDAPTPAGLPTTGVELYFARSLGFALLALGMVTVVLTGALPMTSMVESMITNPLSRPLFCRPNLPRLHVLRERHCSYVYGNHELKQVSS